MNDKNILYVLHDELGRVKFGITSNLPRRINQIRTATGLQITGVYSEVFNNAYEIEQRLLLYFERYRIEKTEWVETGLSFRQMVKLVQKFIKKAGYYDECST